MVQKRGLFARPPEGIPERVDKGATLDVTDLGRQYKDTVPPSEVDYYKDKDGVTVFLREKQKVPPEEAPPMHMPEDPDEEDGDGAGEIDVVLEEKDKVFHEKPPMRKE